MSYFLRVAGCAVMQSARMIFASAFLDEQHDTESNLACARAFLDATETLNQCAFFFAFVHKTCSGQGKAPNRIFSKIWLYVFDNVSR
jgi:hypothetical protein